MERKKVKLYLKQAVKEWITLERVVAPSEPPARSTAALLQQEPQLTEVWGKENSQPAEPEH